MNPEKYNKTCDWIERIIDSCDISKFEQEKICDKLISNFTSQILIFSKDYNLYGIFEKKLRTKLISKFYKKTI